MSLSNILLPYRDMLSISYNRAKHLNWELITKFSHICITNQKQIHSSRTMKIKLKILKLMKALSKLMLGKRWPWILVEWGGQKKKIINHLPKATIGAGLVETIWSSLIISERLAQILQELKKNKYHQRKSIICSMKMKTNNAQKYKKIRICLKRMKKSLR